MNSAHEYTAANARFALSVEPNNSDLVSLCESIKATRALGKPTVPFKLGLQKKTNPFLRVDISAEIQKNVGSHDGDTDYEIFRKVRKAKDLFRG